MPADLFRFLLAYARVAVMALLPVLFTAFATLPYHLKHGQQLPPAVAQVPADYHLT